MKDAAIPQTLIQVGRGVLKYCRTYSWRNYLQPVGTDKGAPALGSVWGSSLTLASGELNFYTHPHSDVSAPPFLCGSALFE